MTLYILVFNSSIYSVANLIWLWQFIRYLFCFSKLSMKLFDLIMAFDFVPCRICLCFRVSDYSVANSVGYYNSFCPIYHYLNFFMEFSILVSLWRKKWANYLGHSTHFRYLSLFIYSLLCILSYFPYSYFGCSKNVMRILFKVDNFHRIRYDYWLRPYHLGALHK